MNDSLPLKIKSRSDIKCAKVSENSAPSATHQYLDMQFPMPAQ